MAYTTSESHDVLWKAILENHWKYIESEESMQKIELRHDLEDLIEKRLGRVSPNVKFYLEDTRYVFDSSVGHMDDFSAYKASIGFEAISQYANNLFVKPWRKEYKVIKMYSGFYQHEIAANLVNAEKLFQAMGYQLMPNKTLILDGPICPDQVMNIARDAIMAYVECQMMKRIYSELTSLRLSVDWIDIYSFRNYLAADVMQTVKQMALSIKEKHHKKQQQAKMRDTTTYGNSNNNNHHHNSATALAPASSSACSSCNPYQFHVQNQQQQQPVPPPPPASYCGGGGGGGGGVNGVPVGSSQLYNSAVAAPCSIHSQQHQQHQQHQQQQQQQQQQQVPASAYGGVYHPHQSQPLPPHHHHHHHLHPSSYQSAAGSTNATGHGPSGAPALGTMPHSKSLDHYQDAASAAAAAAAMCGINVGYMQRHSIDQPYLYTSSATPCGAQHAMAAAAAAVSAGMAPPPFEGPLDGMLPCGVAGGGGGGGGGGTGSAVGCSNTHHPYNNVPVPGTNGRYPPAMQQYGGNGPNFPIMNPGAAQAMYMMNGGGGAGIKQNGSLMDPCYRHVPMNGGSGGGFMGQHAPLPYTSYRGNNGGPMAGFCPPPDLSMYDVKHLGSTYDPSSSSMATQTAYPNAPQPGASILSSRKKAYDDYDVPQQPSSLRRGSELKSGGGGKKLERYQKNAELLIDYESDMLPEALAERNNQKEHHQQQQHHQHHHHYLHHQTSRNSRQSDFDSYEDEQQQQHQQQQQQAQQQHQHQQQLQEPSSVSRRKNQDGIGCYESWNYVYQNLEKQGYTKDLGERGDFFVDELGEGKYEEDVGVRRRPARATDNDATSRRESTSGTLRRSNNEKLKAMKPKGADKVDGIVKQPPHPERRHERHPSAGGGSTSGGTLVQKMGKVALSPRQLSGEDLLGLEQPSQAPSSSRRNSVTKKQITTTNTTPAGSGPAAAKESNNNSTTTTTTGILINHHHHHNHGSNASGSTGYHNNGAQSATAPGSGGGNTATKKKTATFDTGAVTIINPSPPSSTPTNVAGGGGSGPPSSEWNCNFCTYLNPDVKRICDMCSKSRDFRLEGTATSNGTATCV